jgi:hypothetical protein
MTLQQPLYAHKYNYMFHDSVSCLLVIPNYSNLFFKIPIY